MNLPLKYYQGGLLNNEICLLTPLKHYHFQ